MVDQAQKFYLIKYEYNYGDEFDIEGFQILDENEMKDINEGIDKANYPKEYYFGTNEEIEWKNSKEVRDGITVTELTNTEYHILKNLFNGGFGKTPDFADWRHDTTD